MRRSTKMILMTILTASLAGMGWCGYSSAQPPAYVPVHVGEVYYYAVTQIESEMPPNVFGAKYNYTRFTVNNIPTTPISTPSGNMIPVTYEVAMKNASHPWATSGNVTISVYENVSMATLMFITNPAVDWNVSAANLNKSYAAFNGSVTALPSGYNVSLGQVGFRTTYVYNSTGILILQELWNDAGNLFYRMALMDGGPEEPGPEIVDGYSFILLVVSSVASTFALIRFLAKRTNKRQASL
jgi:hypothetical protein